MPPKAAATPAGRVANRYDRSWLRTRPDPALDAHLGLGQALGVAPGPEVLPSGSTGGNMVLYDCPRVVQEDVLRIPAGQPNAQIRLLATERPGPDPAQFHGEASRFEKDIPAKGHVGPHQIADGCDLAGHAAVGATDDPVELRREPSRATGFPRRNHLPSHSDDGGVVVMVRQSGQPGWVGLCIVVEEGDDAAPSCSNAGISGIGQTGAARYSTRS